MPQRSPATFWLLLAATLVADAISVSWIVRGGLDGSSGALFLALAIAQLSILSVWAILIPKRMRFGGLAPFIAGAVAAVVLALGEPGATGGVEWKELLAFTGIMWIHVAITLALLWLLKPTKLCAGFADRQNEPRWQFSTLHLLIVMTALAILCVLLSKAEMLAEEATSVITLPIANAALLVTVLAAVQLKLHRLLRLAAAIWCALAIAVVCEWTLLAFAKDLNFFAYCLIQAFMLWVWLEVIRPLLDGTNGPSRSGF
jgi:hypothetical protein